MVILIDKRSFQITEGGESSQSTGIIIRPQMESESFS